MPNLVVVPPRIDDEHTCIWREYCRDNHKQDKKRMEVLQRTRGHKKALAEALVSMARTGGMPDTFRLTDARMKLALKALGKKRFDRAWEEAK